jgi:ribosomal protein S18 acetylase RimI-like enzyme
MLKIRPYYPDDLEDVVQLWYQTWHHTFPSVQHPQLYPEWKIRFQENLAVRGDIWVAEVDSYIVGFMVLIKEEQYLDQLFVDAAYQNQGIGSALLNKAKEICTQGLTLHTLRQNTQAYTFYKKHGFKEGRVSTNKVNRQPNIEFRWLPSIPPRLP